jgi:predicted ArsR family transcriptional regulator
VTSSDRQIRERILHAIKAHGGSCEITDLKEIVDMGYDAVKAHLAVLAFEGRVRPDPNNAQSWQLVEEE